MLFYRHPVCVVCISTVVSVLFFLAPQLAHADEANTQGTLEGQVQALLRHVDNLVFDLAIAGGAWQQEPLSTTTLEKIMDTGLTWLSNAQEKSGERIGHFRYEYDPFSDANLDGDNIVRQAGTFYQVGEMAREGFGNPEVLEGILSRGMHYFTSLTKEDAFNDEQFACITRNESSTECKLGAASLALVGLLDFVSAFPQYEDEYADLIEGYAHFIIAMKKEKGGFRDRFRVGAESQPIGESSFSNGEAMLALARYYQYRESEEVRALLDEMFAYISSDKVLFDSPLYLWAMAALRDMHALWPDDAYIQYATHYTNWRVSGFQNRKNTQNNMCAYVEGIGSAYALFDDANAAYDLTLLGEEIDFWLTKLQALQVNEGDRSWVVNDEGALRVARIPELQRATGGFFTSHGTLTQRIDFTQHCLNAYLLRYLES